MAGNKRCPIKLVTLVLVFLLFSFVGVNWARESMGTPAAKAEFEKGEAARKANDYAAAAAAFRKAIDLDPDFAAAHENFIFMTGMTSRRAPEAARPKSDAKLDPKAQAALEKQQQEESEKKSKNLETLYEGWSMEHPDKAGYLWALGDLNYYKDRNKAEKYFLKAIEVDPQYARAYQWLSLVAETRGDDRKAIQYLKKATETNPEEPSYAFYYARAVQRENPALSRTLSLQVADRFPKHERGAQSLYWLANDSEDQTEKIAVFERLKRDFPPGQFGWSSDGMSQLFDIYLKTDSTKALALADDLAKISKGAGEVTSWQERSTYAKNLIQARTFFGEKKFQEAKQVLEATKAPRFANAVQFTLLSAEVQDALGETVKAYNGLKALLVNEPDEVYQAAVVKYGVKLGMTSNQVDEEIWKMREAKATPAKELGLVNFYDDKKVFLADYRGRVVLVNFWYPA